MNIRSGDLVRHIALPNDPPRRVIKLDFFRTIKETFASIALGTNGRHRRWTNVKDLRVVRRAKQAR